MLGVGVILRLSASEVNSLKGAPASNSHLFQFFYNICASLHFYLLHITVTVSLTIKRNHFYFQVYWVWCNMFTNTNVPKMSDATVPIILALSLHQLTHDNKKQLYA